MGYASHEGKAWALEQLKVAEGIEFFLDVGAGAGSWMEAIKPHYLESKWIALEVWKEYAQRFCLHERYQMTILADCRTAPFPVVDVVIMGDVLEHMSKAEAELVWKKARAAARVGVVLSIPVINYPQGHVHGNPYQQHVKDDWTDGEVLSTFEGITSHIVGNVVGTYWARTNDAQ